MVSNRYNHCITPLTHFRKSDRYSEGFLSFIMLPTNMTWTLHLEFWSKEKASSDSYTLDKEPSIIKHTEIGYDSNFMFDYLCTKAQGNFAIFILKHHQLTTVCLKIQTTLSTKNNFLYNSSILEQVFRVFKGKNIVALKSWCLHTLFCVLWLPFLL